MMPLAPTPIVAVPSKPKIGFSIDSIVGGGATATSATTDSNTTTTSKSPVSISDDPGSPASSDKGGGGLMSSTPSPGPPPVHTPCRPSPPTLIRPSVQVSVAAASRENFTFSAPYLDTIAGTMKGLYSPEPVHPSLGLAAAHFPPGLAATAANLAGVAAALSQPMPAPQHAAPPPMFLPAGMGGPLPHQLPRDTYPLYPWLLSRHGRIFPHRFPAGM